MLQAPPDSDSIEKGISEASLISKVDNDKFCLPYISRPATKTMEVRGRIFYSFLAQ